MYNTQNAQSTNPPTIHFIYCYYYGLLSVYPMQSSFIQNILRQALNAATTKDKLVHLSYHFSLFLTVSLLFECRFVA